MVDTTPPVIALNGAANLTVECGSDFVDPGAAADDLCEGDVPVSVSLLSGDFPTKGTGSLVDTFSPGTYILGYDAEDSAGNAATQVTRTVTVVDTAPPVITLNGEADITVECPGPFTDPGATANDLCEGPVSVAVGGDTVDPTTPGAYVITYDAEDSVGNTAPQVTRTVRVVDTIAPVITLNGAASITVEFGSSFTDPGATADDSCEGDVPVLVSLVSGPTKGGGGSGLVDTLTLGTYVLGYDAEDSTGNMAAQVTRTVIVEDTTPPEITLNGAESITIECPGPYVEPGASASDLSSSGTIVVTIGGDTVDATTPGVYIVTYEAIDFSGNVKEITRTVTVVDTTPPVITLNGDNAITVECPGPFTDPGASAEDACEGDLPVSVSLLSFTGPLSKGGGLVDPTTLGTYVLAYDAVDSEGNEATQVTRTVTVVDTAPPVITLNGSATIMVECGDPFTDPGASVADDCQDDVALIEGGDTVDTNTVGDYTITYDAMDLSGNSATQVTWTVTVIDLTPPVITLNGSDPLTVECGDAFTDPGAEADDACDGVVSVTVGGDTVDTSTLGAYTITYDAVDAAGNNATQVTRDVEVVDTTPPVITLNGDAAITVECLSQFVDPGAAADDTCDSEVPVNVSVLSAPSKGTPPSLVDTSVLGDWVLAYDAVDDSGNAAAQVTRTVTVVDTTPPEITLNDSDPLVVECGDAFTDPGAFASDTCEGDIQVTVGGDTVDTSTVGTHTITYDASDSSGNMATQETRDVEVVDTVAPVINLLGGDPLTVECGTAFTDPGVTIDEVCDTSVAPVVAGDTVDTSTLGDYVITYDATDASGNAATQVTRTVSVVDTAGPVITLNGLDPLSVECGSNFADPGATADDACEGPISVTTGGDTVDTATKGTYIITYDAVDSEGNQATQATRTVNVVDTTPPNIELFGADPFILECGDQQTFIPGGSATDVCDTELPLDSDVGQVVDRNTVGDYTVTYEATDSAGNRSTETRTVSVRDTDPPFIFVIGGDFVLFCDLDYTDPGVDATDQCDGNVTGDVVVGGDTVDTSTPGVYVITYDVEDAEGNAAVQATRSVTVVGPCGGTGDALSCPDEAATIGTCVLEADFEDGSDGFTTTGLWTRTNLCAATLQPAGTTFVQSFVDTATCTYDTGQQESGVLDSPVIDLSAFAGGTVVLRFDYLIETEKFSGSDVAEVSVSTNGGANFSAVTTNDPVTMPVGFLCDTGETPQKGVDPMLPEWQTAFIDLSTLAGEANVVIRFSFDSIDELANDLSGFSIDNVCLSAQAATP